MAICVTAGAVFQGHYVMKTIGKGIILSDPVKFAVATLDEPHQKHINEKQGDIKKITEEKMKQYETITQTMKNLVGVSPPKAYNELKLEKKAIVNDLEAYAYEHISKNHRSYFPLGRLSDLAIFVALISAGLFVTLATFSSVPVSTSQSIVGGVLGVGIGIVGFQGNYFQLGVLLKILTCWVISPILTMLLALIFYWIILICLRAIGPSIRLNQFLGFMVIVTAGYVSYSLGMNDVGNAIGPLLSKYPDKGIFLAAFGGIALAIGAFTFGRKVTETVGKSITPLDLPGALAAQISAASGVYIFSMMGIPVSTSQSIVGAVIGVGLLKGAKSVSKSKLIEIGIGWVASPVCAAIFAAISYRLLVSFIFTG